MPENPYQPPASTELPLDDPRRKRWSRLRRIAICQKGVVFSLLIYAAACIVSALPLPERLVVFLLPLVVADVAIGAVLMFLLSIDVYGVFLGITMGLLTLFPVFGLFILALTNGKACAVLRRSGLTVGLLGVSLAEISSAEAAEAGDANA